MDVIRRVILNILKIYSYFFTLCSKQIGFALKQVELFEFH